MKYLTKLFFAGTAGAIVLGGASQAFAAPAAEPKCTRTVNQPEKSTSVMFNDDCSIAYVIPPQEGTARTTAVATTTNINFCPAVNKVGAVSAKTMDSAYKIATKIETMIDDFDPLSEEIAALGDQMAEAQTALTAAQATVSADMVRKADLMNAVAQAKSTYDDCVLLNGPELCTDPLAAWNSAKSELTTFVTTTLSPDQKAAIAAQAAYDTLAAQYANKTSQLVTATQPLFALQEQLMNLTYSVEQSYARYAAMPGVTAQLAYSIPWDTLLHDYQASNPGMTFQRLPIVDATFDWTVVAAGGQMPAVLSYAVPGAAPTGASVFPTGEGVVPPLGSSSMSQDQGSRYFGSSIAAQLVLSLMGVCNYYPNGATGGPVGDVNAFVAYMGGHLNYRYEVSAHRGYTARYNLSQFVSRLESVKKSGGFFSSKTIRTIQEDANSADWFSIAFDQTANGFSYTETEKANITKEAKGQLIERALRLIAVQNGVLPGPGPVPPLGPTGAGIAAGYLMRGCGFWSWCSIGGWVLGTLDSIFGSQKAVAEFKRANNVWVSDTVDDKTILTWTGGVGFKQ